MAAARFLPTTGDPVVRTADAGDAEAGDAEVGDAEEGTPASAADTALNAGADTAAKGRNLSPLELAEACGFTAIAEMIRERRASLLE